MNEQQYKERMRAERKGCIQATIPYLAVSALAAIIAFVSMLSSGADIGETLLVTIGTWLGGAFLIFLIWNFVVKTIDPD